MAQEPKKISNNQLIDYGVSGGLAARGAQYFMPSNDVQISYIHNKGFGTGHLSMAKEYQKLLKSKGINSTLHNSVSLKDQILGFLKGPNRAGSIDTGFGIPNLQDRKIPIAPIDYHKGARPQPFLKEVANQPYQRGALSKIYGSSPKNKVVTLSAGGSGIDLEKKYEILRKSLGGRKDVDFVVLAGDRGKEVAKKLSKYKNTKVLGSLPAKQFQYLTAASDLNIGYTGSSSIAEQLSSKNPSAILSTLTPKSSKPSVAQINLQWARDKGIPTFDASSNPKELSKTLNSLLDSPDLDAINKRSTSYLNEVSSSKKKFLKDLNSSIARGNVLRKVRGGALLTGAGALGYNAYKSDGEEAASKKLVKPTIGAALGAVGGSSATLYARYLGKTLSPKTNSILIGGSTLAGAAAPIVKDKLFTKKSV